MTIHVGLIVENQSDEDVVYGLLAKLVTKPFGRRRFHSRGCGKLRSKCVAWAKDLYTRGCRALVVVQDLDQNELVQLRLALEALIATTAFAKRAVVIPVREIEAWLLADERAIQTSLALRNPVAATRSPEHEADAKRRLYEVIFAASDRRVEYVNTVHNKRITTQADPEIIEAKCPSFLPLRQFATML